MDTEPKPDNPSGLEQLRRRVPLGEGCLFPFRKLGRPTKTGWASPCFAVVARIRADVEWLKIKLAIARGEFA